MKLELGKAYKTADGRKVVIVYLDHDGAYHDSDYSQVWNDDGSQWLAGSRRTSPIISEWDETPRVDRYDLDHIQFLRYADAVGGSFYWFRTPEGNQWWADNSASPEAHARLEQMRRQWDEENGELEVQEGPVRTVTRKEIVPGDYGDVYVLSDGWVAVERLHGATSIRAAIATLTQIAEALEDQA